MKHQSVVNKLKKHADVTSISNHFEATVGDQQVTWINQDGDAICLHVCRKSEKSDGMTDYFPGVYPKSLSSMMNLIGK